jgi:branched-chain amino acid transport system substrate-binding protein
MFHTAGKAKKYTAVPRGIDVRQTGGDNSMRKNIFGLLSLLIVASLLLAACAPAAPGAGGGTIKIATQSPLSGGLSSIGGDIKNGADLALTQLSGPLKEMGFKVELAAYDDEGNPDKGVANSKQIVSDPDILCVVGHYNSGVQIPSSENYHTAGLANVSPANTNPKVTDRGYKEVSRLVGRDDIQGSVGALFAKSKGMATAYVLHDKTAYGQGIAEFFRKEAEAQGIKVLGFEGTEEKANFDALLNPVLSANPDVVYFGGMFDQIAVFIKQARQKGYMGMFLSDDGFDSPEAVSIAGDSLMQGGGTYFSTVSGPAQLYPGTAKFQTDFKAKYNSDPKPFSAQSYDSMGICLKAIENAAKANGNKIPTRAQVTDAVRALKDYPGITGKINFNPKGDLVEAQYYIFKVTSADPAKWSDNEVAETLTFKPPE